MDKIKLDKGIPLPRKGIKYPWAQMEVGDSFLFPKSISDHAACQVAYLATKREKPKAFTTRKTKQGCRCWRTE